MDNKPLETDDLGESLEDIFEDTSAETPQETGSEDVGGKSEFTKKLEELSGRTFKDDADAEKHYSNLKSFVGKRQDKPEAKAEGETIDKPTLEKLVEAKLQERDFIYETPAIKDHLDLVRSVANTKNIPLKEAWKEVEPYVGAFEASKKEKTVVDSKNRPNVPQSKEFQNLAEKAKTEGLNEREQAELVKSYLGKF